jgi:CubicO group peptidase (beta-lactamase class C family)
MRGQYDWRTIARKSAGMVRRKPEVALPAGIPVQPAFALSATVYNRPAIRRACLPASGGIMNARAIARHYASLIGNGVDGIRLLPPGRVKIATTLQTDEVDLVQGWTMRKALGYLLSEPSSPMGPIDRAFGHSGLGGSLGFADPAYNLAFGLAKNSLIQTGPGRSASDLIAREVRAALGIPAE